MYIILQFLIQSIAKSIKSIEECLDQRYCNAGAIILNFHHFRRTISVEETFKSIDFFSFQNKEQNSGPFLHTVPKIRKHLTVKKNYVNSNSVIFGTSNLKNCHFDILSAELYL